MDAKRKKVKRVVMVDDEVDILEALRGGFMTHGFLNVAAFTDSEAAREYLSHNPFDVLITDLMMPKVTGMELAKLALAKGASPVIVTSGLYQSDETLTDEVAGLGVIPVAKPYAISDILANLG